MVFCENCKTENSTSANFCQNCGKKINHGKERKLTKKAYIIFFMEKINTLIALMNDFTPITEGIGNIDLNEEENVSFLMEIIENEEIKYLDILLDAKSVIPPEIFTNVHKNFILGVETISDSVNEFYNAVKLADQDHMDRGAFLIGIGGSKTTSAINEFNDIIQKLKS